VGFRSNDDSVCFWGLDARSVGFGSFVRVCWGCRWGGEQKGVDA